MTKDFGKKGWCITWDPSPGQAAQQGHPLAVLGPPEPN